MKRRFAFGFPSMVIPFFFLGGLVVMLLWNAILPQVLGLSALNYWQATGILVLTRILFGGFTGGPFRSHRGGFPPWITRWDNMSEEEKMKLKEEMQSRKEEWKKRFRGEA